MSSSKSEGQQQVQDPQLVALEAEINKLKGKINGLDEEIKAFKADKTPKDEFSQKNFLNNQAELIEDKKRLNGLEADRRERRAQAFSAATSTG